MEIEQLIVSGGRVHLEFAGMDHDADGRGDGEGYATHDGVRDTNELDLKRTDLDLLAGLYAVQRGILPRSCSSSRRSTRASVNAVP